MEYFEWLERWDVNYEVFFIVLICIILMKLGGGNFLMCCCEIDFVVLERYDIFVMIFILEFVFNGEYLLVEVYDDIF